MPVTTINRNETMNQPQSFRAGREPNSNDGDRPDSSKVFLTAYVVGVLIFGVGTALVLKAIGDTNRQMLAISQANSEAIATALAKLDVETEVDLDVQSLAAANAEAMSQALSEAQLTTKLDVDRLAVAIGQANRVAFEDAVSKLPASGAGGAAIDTEAFALAMAEANAQAFAQAVAKVKVENHIDTKSLSYAIARANARAYASALAKADLDVNIDVEKMAALISRANAQTISRAMERVVVQCNCNHSREASPRGSVTRSANWDPARGRGVRLD